MSWVRLREGETYYRAEKGEYQLLTLARRATEQSLPDVLVTDLREVYKDGLRRFLRGLRQRLEETLAAKEQAILFINRRAYAHPCNAGSAVLCRSARTVRCR